MMKNIVSVDWLYENLENENVIPVDCRFYLDNKDQGQEEYHDAHIPGAHYADLEKHLSGTVHEHGGRHPLPELNQFVNFLESIGVDETKTVVAYDAQNTAMAARLWWMLKYLGHEKAYVLDGGFQAWEKKNYPLTEKLPETEKTTFNPDIQYDMVADLNEVKDATENDDIVLVDARDEARYLGKTEPIDPKAGHIPSALNRFFMENIEQGQWVSSSQLKERFEELTDKPVINYCGSGVTACVNVLALDEIGKKSKLYIGSWSDWSSYDENQVETERK
ncbi:sulfurtransferase [Pseudalkalibacillus sp. SCS-8]|uniref:sulfurtransferase n=1 Tax=Pseudalkalibacillus nanhaiensis TaxID=3115291 RepID=UPI0032D9F418